MDLVKLGIHGYKRFAYSSSIYVDTKLVAIVGPNEIGKTSFLRAIEHITNCRPFDDLDFSRSTNRRENQPLVWAMFALDESDLKKVADIAGATKCRWLRVTISSDGEQTISISPKVTRDIGQRESVLARLRRLLQDEENDVLSTAGTIVHERAKIHNIISILESQKRDFNETDIEEFRAIATSIADNLENVDSESLRSLPDALRELADSEECQHPYDEVCEILQSRVPRLLLFEDDDRNLQSSYVLKEVVDTPPGALRNLVRLADLSLNELSNAVENGNHGLVETLLETANSNLRRRFRRYWGQSKVVPRLRMNAGRLQILVGGQQSGFFSIGERSDGLRWFIALAGFVYFSDTKIKPILLVDEAERHLHYDAQADLVQLVAEQDVAEKVIYTTHSLGCLPEDIGTGIKVVVDDTHKEQQGEASRILNYYWQECSPGLSPLLTRMGATTLAFASVRRAVLVEGVSDAILLPALLREATKRQHLGYQVIPGLAEADMETLKGFGLESARVTYLVDGDISGSEIQRNLRRVGVSDPLMFRLEDSKKNGLVLEDLVDTNVYMEAVNKEFRRSHGNGMGLVQGAFVKGKSKLEVLREYCLEMGIEEPNKRAVAEHIRERARMKQRIVDGKRARGLCKLHERIAKALELSN